VSNDYREIDRADRNIVLVLQENARATLAEIAERVDLSPSAVKRRIDRLEEDGVIRGYTALVDDSRLGNPLEAFCELTFAGTSKVADIVGIGEGISEVEAVFTTAGDPDALALIRVRDVAHLTAVIDRLRRSGRVTGTKTLMVLDTWRPRRRGMREPG
jgi:Lrp/AsnC family leucine-responsive transcriptional regulator